MRGFIPNQVIKIFLNICLAICAILTCPSVCFSRDEFSIERDQKYIKTLQSENPTLANFEKRLLEIKINIQAIVKDYKDGKMPKEKAIEKLIILVKARKEIMNDPEYLAESELSPRPPSK